MTSPFGSPTFGPIQPPAVDDVSLHQQLGSPLRRPPSSDIHASPHTLAWQPVPIPGSVAAAQLEEKQSGNMHLVDDDRYATVSPPMSPRSDVGSASDHEHDTQSMPDSKLNTHESSLRERAGWSWKWGKLPARLSAQEYSQALELMRSNSLRSTDSSELSGSQQNPTTPAQPATVNTSTAAPAGATYRVLRSIFSMFRKTPADPIKPTNAVTAPTTPAIARASNQSEEMILGDVDEAANLNLLRSPPRLAKALPELSLVRPIAVEKSGFPNTAPPIATPAIDLDPHSPITFDSGLAAAAAVPHAVSSALSPQQPARSTSYRRHSQSLDLTMANSASEPTLLPSVPTSATHTAAAEAAAPKSLAPNQHAANTGDGSTIQMSLCASQLSPNTAAMLSVFEANLVTHDQLCEDPAIVFNSELVIKVQDRLYPGHVALPLLLSQLAFGLPLVISDSVFNKLCTSQQLAQICSNDPPGPPESEPSVSHDDRREPDTQSGDTQSGVTTSQSDTDKMKPAASQGFGWLFGLGRRQRSELKPSASGATDSPTPTLPPASASAIKSGRPAAAGAKFRKSLRPSNAMLKSLHLKPGRNMITFSVTSSMQGEQKVAAHIYLWSVKTKIVISDIDGTITKSDILGNLMPLVGRDWSHSGVAKLFSNIKNNGYQLLYLTSRAIGQAALTRGYIRSVKQAEHSLPDGPVIMSPDRLIHSFKREVVYRRPQDFKIIALGDLRDLFPNVNPFYAGFGNRHTDQESYLAVGVPASKIFIINRHSVISQHNFMYSKSYPLLDEMVDSVFPPVDQDRLLMMSDDSQFNVSNFWKAIPFGDLSDLPDLS